MTLRKASPLAIACLFIAGCGSGPPVGQDDLTISIPASSIFDPSASLDPQILTLLNQQSHAFGDVSTLLNGSKLSDKLAFPEPLAGTLSPDSPLLLGQNPPLTFSAGGAVLDLSALFSRAADLQKQVDDLGKRRAEQEAILKLNEPQVRALERALGIGPWDRWIDRALAFAVGLLPFLLQLVVKGSKATE